MTELKDKAEKLLSDLKNTKDFLLNSLRELNSSIHIFTHLDADGLASGAILGKA